MRDRLVRAKLLVVDDEKVIADTLVMIFLQHGYDARAVYSAEQALEAIVDWRPAVAIVDIILPQMNGIELANVLRAQEPSMEVLLITGQIVGDLLAERLDQAGHRFDVLMKPVQVPALIENTERLLANFDHLRRGN
jgi:DNA-binding NtrC family response regulator